MPVTAICVHVAISHVDNIFWQRRVQIAAEMNWENFLIWECLKKFTMLCADKEWLPCCVGPALQRCCAFWASAPINYPMLLLLRWLCQSEIAASNSVTSYQEVFDVMSSMSHYAHLLSVHILHLFFYFCLQRARLSLSSTEVVTSTLHVWQ